MPRNTATFFAIADIAAGEEVTQCYLALKDSAPVADVDLPPEAAAPARTEQPPLPFELPDGEQPLCLDELLSWEEPQEAQPAKGLASRTAAWGFQCDCIRCALRHSAANGDAEALAAQRAMIVAFDQVHRCACGCIVPPFMRGDGSRCQCSDESLFLLRDRATCG